MTMKELKRKAQHPDRVRAGTGDGGRRTEVADGTPRGATQMFIKTKWLREKQFVRP